MKRLTLIRAIRPVTALTIPAMLATALLTAQLALSPVAWSAEQAPGDVTELSLEGLTEQKRRPFDEYLQTDPLDLDAFTAIHIHPVTTTFRRNWQRDQNRFEAARVRDSDVERIRQEMSELLFETLTDTLRETRFAIAAEPGPGVLVATARIVDLDLIAPDVPSASSRFTYSDSAGKMTLQLHLADGVSGEPVLYLSDRREDPREDILEWRTRPYNKAIAGRLMNRWSNDVAELLEKP